VDAEGQKLTSVTDCRLVGVFILVYRYCTTSKCETPNLPVGLVILLSAVYYSRLCLRFLPSLEGWYPKPRGNFVDKLHEKE
jgi:hypothetical protein